MFAFAISHGANQSDLLHRVGDMGPALSDLDAADGRGDGLGRTAVIRVGLGIESFELARSAAHEEKDASHAALPQLVGLKRHRLLPAQEARPCRSNGYIPQEGASADNSVTRSPDVHQGLEHGRDPFVWIKPTEGLPRAWAYLFV